MDTSDAMSSALSSWRCTDPLPAQIYRDVRRTLALDAFKWDGQVGDDSTLAPFAVVLPKSTWAELARTAEKLAGELAAVEVELAGRPEIWRALGLPRAVRAALHAEESWTPAAARVMRFDFHPTHEGWRVSEVNSDVPGGYTESSVLPRLMATHANRAHPVGDPTSVLCDALAAHAHISGLVALLAAPGYMEDGQVVAQIASTLRARGVRTCCLRPEQLFWRDSRAYVATESAPEPVDAVFRFYQGEWLADTPPEHWKYLLRGGLTPVCNPATAILSESKRLPQLYSELDTRMPTWRQVTPAAYAAFTSWANKDRVLKRSYSNNGDAVVSRYWSRRRDRALALVHGLIAPTHWTAQDLFDVSLLQTPVGAMRACIGVFVVNGRAAGIYGRLSTQRLIDYRAIDAAILVDEA